LQLKYATPKDTQKGRTTMNMQGNTILVTGGNSGIGEALAVAFHKAGNTVIIAGRRADALAKVVAANPGMTSYVLDVADGEAIKIFAATVAKNHPHLNVLVNNAGIGRVENALADNVSVAEAEETIAINVLGPIRLTSALLPHLRGQASSAIINLTSGLAFVPLAIMPTYSASKAAIHSYSASLRHQLRDTSVKVIELAPPMVATEFAPGQSQNPMAMPLDDYISETMALLATGENEIIVERTKFFRNAEAQGKQAEVFAMVNSH
jgi:uncharacterized oxidoreductase